MTKYQLLENIKKILNEQISNMSNNSRAIGFFKPMINQVIDKNIHKLNKYIDFIANDEGEIDLTDTLNQMINNVMTMEPFKINVPVLNDIEIGGGYIKFQLPFVNKSISFDSNDLDNIRRTLLEQ